MTTTHDTAVAVGRSPAPRRCATSSGGRTGPEALVHLQRTSGNQAVASLVERGNPPVQRGLFDLLGGLLGAGGTSAGALAGQGAQAGAQQLGGMIGGPFGQILSNASGGLGGAAISLVGGDTAGALSGLRTTGAEAAGPLAQSGLGMLGNVIGGQAGGLVGGLGGAVGQGLSSVVMGGSPAQAASGVLGAATPGLMDMASRFLGGI